MHFPSYKVDLVMYVCTSVHLSAVILETLRARGLGLTMIPYFP